jgi:hypothetical protein
MYPKEINQEWQLYYYMLRGIYGDAIADQFKESYRDFQTIHDQNPTALRFIQKTLISVYQRTQIGEANQDDGYFDELSEYIDNLNEHLREF